MLKMTKELDQLLETLILPCVERVDPAGNNISFKVYVNSTFYQQLLFK